jgi:hypothetical protein
METLQPLTRISTAMTPLALRADLGAGTHGHPLTCMLHRLSRLIMIFCMVEPFGMWWTPVVTVGRYLPSLLRAGFSPDVTGPISKVADKVRSLRLSHPPATASHTCSVPGKWKLCSLPLHPGVPFIDLQVVTDRFILNWLNFLAFAISGLPAGPYTHTPLSPPSKAYHAYVTIARFFYYSVSLCCPGPYPPSRTLPPFHLPTPSLTSPA